MPRNRASTEEDTPQDKETEDTEDTSTEPQDEEAALAEQEKQQVEAELEKNQQYLEEEAQNLGPLGNPLSLKPAVEGEEPEESTEEHKPRLILVGTWVRLGSGENIPVELEGHEAYVTEAPMKNSDGDEIIPYRHQYQDEDTVFTVRTRDEYSATIRAKAEDFEVVSDKGRLGLGSAG